MALDVWRWMNPRFYVGKGIKTRSPALGDGRADYDRKPPYHFIVKALQAIACVFSHLPGRLTGNTLNFGDKNGTFPHGVYGAVWRCASPSPSEVAP
jgi:hypothetical protein